MSLRSCAGLPACQLASLLPCSPITRDLRRQFAVLGSHLLRGWLARPEGFVLQGTDLGGLPSEDPLPYFEFAQLQGLYVRAHEWAAVRGCKFLAMIDVYVACVSPAHWHETDSSCHVTNCHRIDVYQGLCLQLVPRSSNEVTDVQRLQFLLRWESSQVRIICHESRHTSLLLRQHRTISLPLMLLPVLYIQFPFLPLIGVYRNISL